jgi:hypothetical protein
MEILISDAIGLIWFHEVKPMYQTTIEGADQYWSLKRQFQFYPFGGSMYPGG